MLQMSLYCQQRLYSKEFIAAKVLAKTQLSRILQLSSRKTPCEVRL